MSARAYIQSLSSIGPILVKIFEVVERWVRSKCGVGIVSEFNVVVQGIDLSGCSGGKELILRGCNRGRTTRGLTLAATPIRIRSIRSLRRFLRQAGAAV